MRRLTGTVRDSNGTEASLSWTLTDTQRDSHADMLTAVTAAYYRMVGEDAPEPESVETWTEFEEVAEA